MGSGATSQSPDKSLFIKANTSVVKPSISMPVGTAAVKPVASGVPVVAPVITTTGATGPVKKVVKK
jgi:hypothetical protein